MEMHKVNLFGKSVHIPILLTLEKVSSKEELIYSDDSYFRGKPISELKRFYSLYLKSRDYKELAEKYPCKINVKTLVRKHLPRIPINLSVRCPSCGGGNFSRKVSSRSHFHLDKPPIMIFCENKDCQLKINPFNKKHCSSCACNICVQVGYKIETIEEFFLGNAGTLRRSSQYKENMYYWGTYKGKKQILKYSEGYFQSFITPEPFKLDELDSVCTTPIPEPSVTDYMGLNSFHEECRLAYLSIKHKRIFQSSISLSSPTNNRAIKQLMNILLELTVSIFENHKYGNRYGYNRDRCQYSLAVPCEVWRDSYESEFSFIEINKHGVTWLNLPTALLYSGCLLYEEYPDDDAIIACALNQLFAKIYNDAQIRKRLIKKVTGSLAGLAYLKAFCI